MKRWLPRLALAFALGTGALRAQASLGVVWHLPSGGIAVGDAFEVEVVQTFGPRDEPEPFDEASLWPVTLEFLERRSAPSAAGTPVTVVNHYRARAHAAGDLALPPVVLRVRTPAGLVSATCTPPPLAVRSILPEPAGDMEWPGDVREPPRGAAMAWWVASLLALATGSIWWWRRPRPTSPSPVAVEVPLHERTLARLANLPEPDGGAAAIAAFYAQLAAIVREHAGERFALATAARTSDELVCAVPVGTAALAQCLLACDLVKFAASRPDAVGHAAVRAAATGFVHATAVGGGGS